MPLFTAESGSEKSLNELPRKRVTYDETAQADDVEVVVFDALVRRKRFVDEACANADHLVGGNTRPHAAAADGDTAIHVAARDRGRKRNDEIRVVVARLRRFVSIVDHAPTRPLQQADQMLLQLETAVVRRDTNPPGLRLLRRAPSLITHRCPVGGALRCVGSRPFAGGAVFIGTGAAKSGRINSIGIGNTMVEFWLDPMSSNVCM